MRQTCAPRRRPAVSPAAWRALSAVTAPAGLGLWAGRPAEGVMVAMGALSAVLTDVAAAYRHRAITMLLPQLLGVVGAFAALTAAGRAGEPYLLPALGVAAGVLARLGPEGSLGAMVLLMDAAVARDLPLPGPLWLPPALMLLGGLSVVALALAGRPFFRGRAERALLAQCLAGCAAVLEPDAAGPAGTARRRALHDALEQARHTGAVGGGALLARHLPGLLALAETASSAGARGLAAGPALRGRLRAEAERVAAGRPASDGAWPPACGPLEARLLRAARSAVAPGPGPVGSAGGRDGRHRPGRRRAAARAVLADPQSWLCGLRVGLALLLAGAAAAYWELPHPYWAVLNVVFVCRPDVGPVTGRALERFCGTALGLLGSGLVLACAGPDGALLAVLALAAGLVPALSGTGYLYQAAALATVVLMVTQLAGDPGLPLLLPNLACCAIGCLAAALACELLGPHRHRQLAVARRLADAVEQTALALAPPRPRDGGAPHLRLASARAEFERARREPPWRQGTTARWAALIDEVERTVDTALAPAVPADHHHFDATRHHLHRLAADLHRLAARP
ncbi:FUSC family protein [Kitasatospora sp. SolWspMP-SS2h]|uniref:FUSC family protein n=1 Tax=Kitasatospora sp. SolWspMP-SS2h TaxID=1305729 RepID=UPI0011B945F1|nr:FUSC family protein [Kitasatospora sp. SolWspMP-SS2h]